MATYSLMDDGNAINSGGVAVFIAKVWRIVEDPEYNHLISWSEVSKWKLPYVCACTMLLALSTGDQYWY